MNKKGDNKAWTHMAAKAPLAAMSSMQPFELRKR
jgi:hypothetical protein